MTSLITASRFSLPRKCSGTLTFVNFVPFANVPLQFVHVVVRF